MTWPDAERPCDCVATPIVVMMEPDSDIKFVFDEAAMVVTIDGKRYIVVGDLHIGMERKLEKAGVHARGASMAMLDKLVNLSREFDTRRLILLGDVKESILYPDAIEAGVLRDFFEGLAGFETTVIRGNHDAHLDEIIDVKPVDELRLGKFAFLHGHRWPSGEAMMLDYIITAHNHAAVSIRDSNGAVYVEKAWLIAGLNAEMAAKQYDTFNNGIRIIIMPAFNDLITGMPINERRERMLNPLLNNGVFDLAGATTYTIRGDIAAAPG